jgi:hypothetical protein
MVTTDSGVGQIQSDDLVLRAARAMEHSPLVSVSYDRDSDTLMLHLGGRPRAATSVPIERASRTAFFVRLDRASDEIVGFQIEDFTASFLEDHPELADTLNDADLRGITQEEVAEIIARFRGRAASDTFAHFLANLAAA